MSSGTVGASLAGALDQAVVQERRRALRALLRQPLLGAQDADFGLVRRHLDWLREWLSRHAAWRLQMDGGTARLYKVPADPLDASRPARDPKTEQVFSRRRYIFFCLALAALERADRQTTLGRLAEEIARLAAAEASFEQAGLRVELEERSQRRDLVHVVRLLLELGVLSRVDGKEEDYLRGGERGGDVLYDVHRFTLAALLQVQQGPSLVDEPTVPERLRAITLEPVPESDEGRNRRLRSFLTRKLLDDPVLYYADLDDEQLAYLQSQRHALTRSIEEATGLVAEVRAEGIAMVDERGDLTDVGLPEEGTDGHLALLLAERLAKQAQQEPGRAMARAELEAYVAELIDRHGRHWRKDARAPGAEIELARSTLDRLAELGLVTLRPDGVLPRPAIGRFALGRSVPEAGS